MNEWWFGRVVFGNGFPSVWFGVNYAVDECWGCLAVGVVAF